jgi:DNA-binding CsgD family transcriptional regulator/tetratricopeptide (TPR) repeat protein
MRSTGRARKMNEVLSSGLFCRELIGRSSELAFVLDRVRADVERTSIVVVVRGEAGIGKTRLVEEAARAARDDGYRTAIGSTREYANAPYAALEEALAMLGIPVVPAVEDGAADAKMRRFNAIAEGIAAEAGAQRPGLLIGVEDLHWADAGTLDLLRFLSKRLAGRSVTFLVTYRVDEIEADSARARSILALERDAQAVVTLSALPAQQIERLLASVIRDGERSVSRRVLTEIRELSDGRPLFAEELLRGVFERLDRDADAVPTVPATIRVAVRERFSALTETDRAVLLHAALIGRRFSARFVASFSGHDLSVVYAALRRARDLQLIVEQPGNEADAFAFRHALTREAIYEQMLRAETQLMHAKVAQALAEETSPDVAAIADHLWHAGDAQAAAHWSERAGDDAYAVFAYTDAARAYERAYRLGIEGRRAKLAARAGDSWYALGELARAVEWFGRAAEAHDDAGEPRLARRLALRKARILFEGGRYEAGLRAADELAATAEVEPALRFEAELMVAGLLTAHGRAAEALERLTRAEQLGVQPEPFISARFSATFATALGYVGRYDEARPRFEVAVAEAREIGDYDQLLRTYNNWANLELGYGTLARAQELYARSRAVAAQTKISRIAAWTMQNESLVAVLAGDLDRASDLLARSEEIEHGLPVVHRWSVAISLQVETLRGQRADGDLDRANGELDAAIDDVQFSSVGILAATIAYRLAAEHRIAEAGDVLARVVPIFKEVEVPYWLLDATSLYGDGPTRARARELAAEIAQRPGALPARGFLAMIDVREALRRRRRDESVAHAETAAAAFHEAGWTLHEAYALELGGRVAEAIALFRRMGASAEVARITHVGGFDRTRRRGDATLTGREREIAGLVAAGHPTRRIAERLVISERTVETHIAAIYRKLGVTSRRGLEALLNGAAEP